MQAPLASINKWIGGLAAVAAGYRSISGLIGKITGENTKLADAISRLANRVPERELKLQIQAGLTPEQLREKRPQIKQNLLKTPSTTLAGALQVETQLASSGFNKQDIASGAALLTMLDLKAATNQFGREMQDPKAAVQSVAQYREALGFAHVTAAGNRWNTSKSKMPN